MNIRWLGHSSFLITSEKGVRIITDPRRRGKNAVLADIALISHGHLGHSYTRSLGNDCYVIDRNFGEIIHGINIERFVTIHGLPILRGTRNVISCFKVDGIKMCHLGDIGCTLAQDRIKEIERGGKVDVLFVPVGGFATVGPKAAAKICEQLEPRVIIPMHFRDEYKLPLLKPVSCFTKIFPGSHSIESVKIISERDILRDRGKPCIAIFQCP